MRSAWTPVGDNAGISLHTWDVGSRNTPLLGVYSRMGWHHPGPLLFYLFAGPLRLLGGAPTALLACAVLNTLLCGVGIVWLAARSASVVAAIVLAVGTGLMCIGYGSWIMEPWNAYVALMPFALFLVAAWLASGGDVPAAPIAVAAGSLAVQSHLGTLPPVALIGAAAVVLRILYRPTGVRSSSVKQALLLVLVLAVLWVAPIFEQIKNGQNGNVAHILRFFRQPGSEAAIGWNNGLAMAGAQLLPWGPWLGHERLGMLSDVLPAPLWQLAASCAPLSVALALAIRFRDALALRLVTLLGVAVLACILGNAQIRGLAYNYLTLWTRPVAMLIAAAPCLVLVRKYGAHHVASSEHARFIGAAAVALVCLTVSVRALQSKVPLEERSRIYAPLVATAARAQPHGATVRAAAAGALYEAFPDAMAVALERAGRKVRLPPDLGPLVGEHRTVGNAFAMRTLLVVIGSPLEHVEKRKDARLLYKWDPLPAQDRATVNRLRAKLEDGLRAAHREDLLQSAADPDRWFSLVAPASLDRGDLERYLELGAGVEKRAIALFEIPAGTPWYEVLW